MGHRRPEGPAPEIIWHKEGETLTLEGEPVLEYSLSWPEVSGAGWGGKRISRYYARLAQEWQRRWRQEVYIKSCLEQVQCRATARHFTPWSGKLAGEVTLWEGDLLSLRMSGEETRGDGRTNRVRWGDTWRLREGRPCPLKEFVCGGRRWKKRLLAQLFQQGSQRREAGDCFLDPNWEQEAGRLLPTQDVCLTPDGVELSFPQCAFSPAAEGPPSFRLPRSGGEEENFPPLKKR